MSDKVTVTFSLTPDELGALSELMDNVDFEFIMDKVDESIAEEASNAVGVLEAALNKAR